MIITEIAQKADLNDKSSMADALNEIAKQRLAPGQVEYLFCVDMDDPSQMYDALIHFGAVAPSQYDCDGTATCQCVECCRERGERG
jgi:hypothetical protein